MDRWTAEPGSTLAKARSHGHRLIDLRLEFGGETRNEVYAMLAREMGIPAAKCHFGMFSLSQCEHAISILNRI